MPEAHKEDDCDNIFKAIEGSVGFQGVNVDQLRAWYLDIAVGLAEEDENAIFNVAVIIGRSGEHEGALRRYKTALSSCGENSSKTTASIFHGMAIMYDVHGQYDKSLEYYGNVGGQQSEHRSHLPQHGRCVQCTGPVRQGAGIPRQGPWHHAGHAGGQLSEHRRHLQQHSSCVRCTGPASKTRRWNTTANPCASSWPRWWTATRALQPPILELA